ncbi:N-acetylmuramoyl-L-alanine amidase [Roseibium sp.]|uniref:N-acetylmuramoyl-L-alanine amidase n=1 Tax=Roseibium sp. TaxID=1936156 RepID=UPI003D0D71E5
MRATIRIDNRYRINRRRQRRGKHHFDDPVAQADIFLYELTAAEARRSFSALRRGDAVGRTNNRGQVKIDLPSGNGTYLLRILPQYWDSGPVGPALARPFPAGAGRVYRPLDLKVKIEGNPGRARIASAVTASNSNANGEAWKVEHNGISIVLQPVWITDFTDRRKLKTKTDLIVVHLTSGSDPYGAVRKISGKAGAHYLILKNDGQIIKFINDDVLGSHAGGADHPGDPYWAGDKDINSRSIGIELENVKPTKADADFTEEQYKSLLWLLDELVNAHGIDPKRVIGHSDLAVEMKIREFDPGFRFDWPRLGRAGFGPPGPGQGYPTLRSFIAAGPEILETIYGGIFKGGPNDTELRLNDNDGGSVYGGNPMKNITGQPIREILTDLNKIGYWVGRSGPGSVLNADAMRAVQYFQIHFFATEISATPGSGRNARLDRETALRIFDAAAMA